MILFVPKSKVVYLERCKGSLMASLIHRLEVPNVSQALQKAHSMNL
uniref:ATE2 n=1 Tax=Arundo donax TaxID=35708 RepID=A0A0A9JUN3_ARUDO